MEFLTTCLLSVGIGVSVYVGGTILGFLFITFMEYLENLKNEKD